MRQLQLICGLMLCLFVSCPVFAEGAKNPLGYWNTVDDKTGQVLSVVQIWQDNDGTYNGKIVKIFPVLGQHPNDLCKKCSGKRKNKPLMGMVVIWQMRADPNHSATWINGYVYDPNSDNTYHGKLRLSEDGQQLFVRGYIGIPLLGRTETWLRTTAP